MSNFGLRWVYLYSAYRAEMVAGHASRWRTQRNRRLSANAFSMSEKDFKKTYRLTKSITLELITELESYIRRERRIDALNVTNKVLITLAFFASGSYQTLVGQSSAHCVSQPTVSRAVKQVTAALNNPSVFNKYVVFPRTREAKERVRRGFHSAFGIPGVIGCIDGTHVCIIKPSDHEEAFYCRKGYHSLNVMIICDADLNILCVDPSSPGSTHDSAVWRDHPLNQYLLGLNEAGQTIFLLGDSGYPLRKNLMTPILNAVEGTPEAYYYDLHVKARNVVERTIGVLKSRFRCLLIARQLHYKPEIAGKIVNACCVLHNIANHSRLQVPELSARERDYERRQQMQLRHEEAALAPPNAVPEPSSRRRYNAPLQQGRAMQEALVANLWANRNISLINAT